MTAPEVECFISGEEFSIGSLKIESFSVSHDAADPVGFRVSDGSAVLLVATDLGQVTTLVRQKARDVDALVIESNHDPLLLQEAPYPWELKQRIASRSGHLSNDAAAALVEELGCESDGQRLQLLIGAHVSEKSNHPDLVYENLQSAVLKGRFSFRPQVVVADAYTPTELFCLKQ